MEREWQTTHRGTAMWGYHPCEFDLLTYRRRYRAKESDATAEVVEYLLEYALDGHGKTGDFRRFFQDDAAREAFMAAAFTDVRLERVDEPPTVEPRLASALLGRPVTKVETRGRHTVRLYFGADSGHDFIEWTVFPLVGDRETAEGPAGAEALNRVRGLELADVDALVDEGFVVTFRDGTTWRLPARLISDGDYEEFDDDFVACGPDFTIDPYQPPFAWTPPDPAT